MNRFSGRLLLIVAALVLLLALIPAVASGAGDFVDVPDGHTFKADIEWLADAGVTKGCNPPANDRFCPGDPVTRGQMAAFMYRLSGGDDRTIDGRLDALEAENAALRALLAGVTRNGDTLQFSGMNLQIVNGTGTTDHTPNGFGNVVIGYNEQLTGAKDRSGSHYLVIGSEHSYAAFGGIVAGLGNTASSGYASVTGGYVNAATGFLSSVTGGYANTASGERSSVTGGYANTASGRYSSVTGGDDNTASGIYSSVSAGTQNVASGIYSSVSAGLQNTASGDYSSVSGGARNVPDGLYASISGGEWNEATNDYSTISGGRYNDVTGQYSSVSGGSGNSATGSSSSILGGQNLTLGTDYGTYPSCGC